MLNVTPFATANWGLPAPGADLDTIGNIRRQRVPFWAQGSMDKTVLTLLVAPFRVSTPLGPIYPGQNEDLGELEREISNERDVEHGMKA